MFEIQNLKYKGILDIPSLSIDEEKTTAIIGRSGSGKSTLLRLLNKLISPDSGSIAYRGISLEKWDSVALRRQVVMLSQHPILFPGNIRDNLQIGRQFSEKIPVSDEKLKEALDWMELADKTLDGPTASLSGGEQQRLAIARVLLMEPEVLLLDEPSSALDVDTAQSIITALMRQAGEKDIGVIMVTHSRYAARHYSHRILTLEEGKIVKDVPNSPQPLAAEKKAKEEPRPSLFREDEDE